MVVPISVSFLMSQNYRSKIPPLSEMLASSPMVLSPEGTSVALAGGLSVKPGTFFGQPAGTERRVSTSSAGVSDFFAT